MSEEIEKQELSPGDQVRERFKQFEDRWGGVITRTDHRAMKEIAEIRDWLLGKIEGSPDADETPPPADNKPAPKGGKK